MTRGERILAEIEAKRAARRRRVAFTVPTIKPPRPFKGLPQRRPIQPVSLRAFSKRVVFPSSSKVYWP